MTYFVRADRVRLKQVLINLLSNAIKYNAKGGAVESGLRGEARRERIRVSIKDAGAGLSPEQIAQLFQPFIRLGQEVGGEQGTGIGLVVAKRLVELMGGVIGVESEVGVGSVFWFELDGGRGAARFHAGKRTGSLRFRCRCVAERVRTPCSTWRTTRQT